MLEREEHFSFEALKDGVRFVEKNRHSLVVDTSNVFVKKTRYFHKGCRGLVMTLWDSFLETMFVPKWMAPHCAKTELMGPGKVLIWMQQSKVLSAFLAKYHLDA